MPRDQPVLCPLPSVYICIPEAILSRKPISRIRCIFRQTITLSLSLFLSFSLFFASYDLRDSKERNRDNEAEKKGRAESTEIQRIESRRIEKEEKRERERMSKKEASRDCERRMEIYCVYKDESGSTGAATVQPLPPPTLPLHGCTCVPTYICIPM